MPIYKWAVTQSGIWATLYLLACDAITAAPSGPKKPHIVYMLADNIGYGGLGVQYISSRRFPTRPLPKSVPRAQHSRHRCDDILYSITATKISIANPNLNSNLHMNSY